MTSVPQHGVTPRARAALWIGCFCAGLLLMPGFNSFESPSYPTVVAILTSGSPALDLPAGVLIHRGPDGRTYDVHEFGSVVFSLPFARAAAWVSPPGSDRFRRVYELALGIGVVALSATTALLLVTLLAHLGVPWDFAAWRLPALLAASQYLVYATNPSDVSIAAPLVAGTVLSWLRAERGARAGWLAAGVLAGFAVAVKITLATFVPLLAILAVTGPERPPAAKVRALAWLALGLAPGFALAGWWNLARTGSALHTPYPAELHAFVPALLPSGLAAALVSPGKGLLVYTPALALLPWALRHSRRLALLVTGSFLLSLLRVSATVGGTSWGGWGNRYYVPWVPLFATFLVLGFHRRAGATRAYGLALAVAAGIGAVANVAGVVTNWMYHQQRCGYDAWDTGGTNACAVAALPTNLLRAFGAPVPEVIVSGASPANVFASNRLAVSWYAARFTGVPAGISWTLGVLLLLGAAVSFKLAIRLLGSPSAPHAAPT